MEKAKMGPRDFFMWVGAMLALYVSVISLIALLFNYIDTAYPDALSYNYDPYSTAIRVAIASLAVLFPIYLALTYAIRRDTVAHPEKRALWIRRWILMLTVFIAGATLAIDLITLINTFLGGEITTRFILKVAIVLLVMGGGFLHFLADLWGYWDKNPRYAQSVAGAVSFLIVATIGAGFYIIGSPSQIRMYQFDDQKVNGLQTMQSLVLNYWQTESAMPPSIASLNDPLNSYTSVPKDPQSGASYEYATTSALGFKLCATFNAESQPNSPSAQQSGSSDPMSSEFGSGTDLNSANWFHPAGHYCYVRTIDPKRYPPAPKPGTTTAIPTK